ncbi:putative sap domain-containing protein [Phaeoacremonium minimum UCRPA7]|uniref:Putative sap domain-containing protein n=1 Tax=Phaeoacremonium minimum (strain UCR-PA7) TaxID=1286976 RepID=R8BQ82_PHAM7|nr:putative sap domain-containing protein [Phaeoacremonium minimum UCRPA7]EOO01538.1 putative sap domain-containing protein [Phaeoacremonium minimum UCRPA7]
MATDWTKLKVVDLKAELKRRGLPQNGLKQELIARLNASDTETPTSDEQSIADPSASASAEPTPVAEEITARTDTISTSQAPAGVQVAEGPSAPTPPPEPKTILSQETPRVEEVINVPAAGSNAQEEADAPSRQETPGAITSEIIQDAQKRKRRSSTPTPSAKRVRPADEQESSLGPNLPRDISPTHKNGVKQDVVNEPIVANNEAAIPELSQSITEDRGERSSGRSPSRDRDLVLSTGEEAYRARLALSEARDLGPQNFGGAYTNLAADERSEQTAYTEPVDDKMIEPSIHPATTSLYIKNFMRPLRAPMVQDYLIELATPPGKSPNPSVVLDFYLDQVRTHAFVQFQNIASAARVRTALHDQIWPDERNRKALWVDFIPPEKVREWSEEERSGGRGNSARWEVIYDQDEDGVVARLEEVGSDAKPRAPAIPVAPKQAPTLSGPDRLYPGIEAAPRGPRNLGGPRSGPGLLGRSDPNTLRTQSNPPLSYQPVSEELARRRIDNIHSFISKHAGRNPGGEMNRYTFENSESFVDRGKEVFIGIRPPHRERERRERGRRDRPGGGPGRRDGPPPFPRGDRYFGAREPVRDDYRAPPARFNEDRWGRNDDDRRPRYRDFREERSARGNYGDSYRSRR